MKVSRRPSEVTLPGRILFLTDDIELIKRQLAGEDLAETPALESLVDNISTDEITPGWVCFYYDETLGHYSLVGLREGSIKPGDLAGGGFDVVVSGLSKGCGSSRETAPYSELWAGVKLVIARSIEKIYGQNSQNIGLLTSTDFGLIDRIRGGESIPLDEFTRGFDPISIEIVRFGGLFNYNKARLAGDVSPPTLDTPARPMSITEKIIAARAVADASTGRLGIPGVKPGDALFVRTDLRFSHDYTTAMSEALLVQALGADARVTDPESVYAFRDHLTFLGDVMPESRKKLGLLDKADNLAAVQKAFAEKQGVRLYDEIQNPDGTKGSEAICHNAVLEDLALPGQIVVGTDSHTCTAGALGCFAFGVGSTDMANSWYTKDVRVRVPESVRFDLVGEPSGDITAKDVMLYILATPYIRESKAIGQVLEFGGPGLAHLNFDERATLTNMAVEAGATTGIVEPDGVVTEYLLANRPGLSAEEIEAGFFTSDEGAEYAAKFTIDLADIAPMVATPGDPRNGIQVTELEEKVAIDIAYGGSCTGGKKTDMDLYAQVLSDAVAKGQTVAPGVEAYIQFGSQKIKEYARGKGYIELFEKAGVRLIDPSCGACINAGPGVSDNSEKVSVSAINRNFPGRSGPGDVYLASPLVVAASAIAGHIVRPASLD
ncbi:MAG: 3-isopropylmalate dehydratase [Deltaproteobacteria bacterium]|nr:3-isopropylmalate dehydratase [Deltaproteobacteria bacterium]